MTVQKTHFQPANSTSLQKGPLFYVVKYDGSALVFKRKG